MGDIIPNQENFIFDKKKADKKPVELGNVTKKIHKTILAVLDMYFACKCDEFTVKQSKEIDKLGMIMEAHLNVLWNLKQAILYENSRGSLMRKPHGTAHIGDFIRRFGPIIYADTDSFESSHKKYTTGVWRGTSKRLGTLVKEMTTASVIQSCAGHLKFYTTLHREDGITKCEKAFGPKNVGNALVIDAFGNISDIRFIVTSQLDKDGYNILRGTGKKCHLFEENDTIFGHSGVSNSTKLSEYLRDEFSDRAWDDITSEDTNVEFSIVRCITYEGSKDSGVGKGVIYATAKNGKKGPPRYDYVTVKTTYRDEKTGKDVVSNVVAQVIMIIQVHVYEDIRNKNEQTKYSKWYLIVQYMRDSTLLLYGKPQTVRHDAIKQLIWDQNKDRSFSIGMIDIEMLVGSAMVIPYFSSSIPKMRKPAEEIQKIFTPIAGKPNVSKDKFWYVDRKFFDRSGWEELIEIDNFHNKKNINNINEEIKIDDINILDFIKANSVRIDIPTPITTTTSSSTTRPSFDLLQYYSEEDNDDNDEE